MDAAEHDIDPDASAFELADRLLLLKDSLTQLKSRYYAVEKLLLLRLEFEQQMDALEKETGSKTYKLGDGDGDPLVSVTCSRKVGRTVDEGLLEAWRDKLPKGIAPPTRTKLEVDAKAYGELMARTDEDAVRAQAVLARVITTKPQKTGVSLKLLTD